MFHTYTLENDPRLLQNTLAVKYGHRIVYLGSVTLGFGMSALQRYCGAIYTMYQKKTDKMTLSLVASTIEQIFFTTSKRTTFVQLCDTESVMANGILVCHHSTWTFGHIDILFRSRGVPMSILSHILHARGSLVLINIHKTTYEREVPIKSDKGDARDDNSIPSEKHSVDKPRPGSEEDGSRLSEKPSYLSQLKIWNGTFSNVGLFKIFMRPFPFILSPVTWFIFLVHGMQTVPNLYICRPSFGKGSQGLTNLGGIVGIIIAICISGPLTDWGTVWLAKRNKGIYEPEFRIFFISTMLFGVFGMANFSMVVSGAAAVTYLLDTHGPDALHVLALSNFSKNIVLYAFTFFANGMIQNRGVKVSLLILAALQAFCWLASFPMYVYGKRVRSYIARHPSLFLVGG
ncbi:hypothetical protein D9615_001033 [Tricholomella constricta]|uniref:Uncharacterized protein n=1 Tax=Tricholomella constricta TaxID=117010 RepID=A0A8H5M971_9AGAR|nr:hypothetical protein D9615_001033 [Tricholomella constricta]